MAANNEFVTLGDPKITINEQDIKIPSDIIRQAMNFLKNNPNLKLQLKKEWPLEVKILKQQAYKFLEQIEKNCQEIEDEVKKIKNVSNNVRINTSEKGKKTFYWNTKLNNVLNIKIVNFSIILTIQNEKFQKYLKELEGIATQIIYSPAQQGEFKAENILMYNVSFEDLLRVSGYSAQTWQSKLEMTKTWAKKEGNKALINKRDFVTEQQENQINAATNEIYRRFITYKVPKGEKTKGLILWQLGETKWYSAQIPNGQGSMADFTEAYHRALLIRRYNLLFNGSLRTPEHYQTYENDAQAFLSAFSATDDVPSVLQNDSDWIASKSGSARPGGLVPTLEVVRDILNWDVNNSLDEFFKEEREGIRAKAEQHDNVLKKELQKAVKDQVISFGTL